MNSKCTDTCLAKFSNDTVSKILAMEEKLFT